jgi:TonB family protein
MGTTAHAMPPVLHVAATWGTTIITLKHLARGESLGDLPAPDGLDLTGTIRATNDSWEVDPRGAVTGKLRLRGRDESVEAIAKSALPFPIIKGDFGLLQYGQYGIFFQCAERPVLDPVERSRDVLVLLALLSSGALHAGAIGFVRALATPPPIMKPLELANDNDYVARFGLRRASLEEPQPISHDSDEPRSSGPVAKESAPASHGAEGKRGPGPVSPRARETRGPLGGASDAIRGTLGSLPSVGDVLALGGAQEMIGGGDGASLHGGADGGGGTSPRFGGGEMKTGWGAPHGGDYGHGQGEQPAITGAPRLRVIYEEPNRRRLNAEQIRRVVVRHEGAIRACYDTELVRDATVRGGVTLAWTIDPEGTVTNASVVSSTIANARVERCVLRQVKSWRFPTSEASTGVASYPFVFGVGAR